MSSVTEFPCSQTVDAQRNAKDEAFGHVCSRLEKAMEDCELYMAALQNADVQFVRTVIAGRIGQDLFGDLDDAREVLRKHLRP
jgi:hypothetical protein